MNIPYIKKLVDDFKPSQTELLKRAKITRPTLKSILDGADTRISIIERLASALGVSPADFFLTPNTEIQLGGNGAVTGHHIRNVHINDGEVLKKTIEEIAEHRKLIEKSQEHISDLTKAMLNLTQKSKK